MSRIRSIILMQKKHKAFQFFFKKYPLLQFPQAKNVTKTHERIQTFQKRKKDSQDKKTHSELF